MPGVVERGGLPGRHGRDDRTAVPVGHGFGGRPVVFQEPGYRHVRHGALHRISRHAAGRSAVRFRAGRAVAAGLADDRVAAAADAGYQYRFYDGPACPPSAGARTGHSGGRERDDAQPDACRRAGEL